MSQALTDATVQADPVHGDQLTETETQILDFENSWWQSGAAKECEIRERFGLSATIYYQKLGRLIERPAALVYQPLLVKRLRRLRDQRQRERSSARLKVR